MATVWGRKDVKGLVGSFRQPERVGEQSIQKRSTRHVEIQCRPHVYSIVLVLGVCMVQSEVYCLILLHSKHSIFGATSRYCVRF